MSARHLVAVRRCVEGMAAGDVPAVAALLSEEYIQHDTLAGTDRGREKVLQTVGRLKQAYPDLSIELHETLADEDKVTARWTARGSDPFHPLLCEVLTIFRLSDGRVVEQWIGWAPNVPALLDDAEPPEPVGAASTG